MNDASPTELTMVDRIRAGDRDALATMFGRHRDRLWQIVEFRLDKRLRGRVDSDDVLQEAFLDASDRIFHFVQEHSGSLFIWLRLIVNQTLANVHRRHLGVKMRDVRRETPVNIPRDSHDASTSMAMQLLGHITSPSNAALREEAAEQLAQAISQLKPLDQEILALRHFEQLTNTEVAEVLDIQKKAASIRYIRAIKRLKQVLAEFPDLAGSSSDPANAVNLQE